MTVVLIAGGVVAFGLLAVGAAALIDPHRVAKAYGLTVDGSSARGFVRATGIRDVAIGVVLAATVVFRDLHLLVVVAIVGVLLSLADLAIAYHNGGKRWRAEHATHVGGAVAFVLVLAMALLAIGM